MLTCVYLSYFLKPPPPIPTLRALCEKLQEAEESVAGLRRENENLEALLVAARRSRDTYWKHSVVMFQEKSK